MTPIPAALDILEDAVLAALATLAPYGPAAWGVLPPGTVASLLSGETRRAWVAQHQDGGGQPAPLLGSAGWRGLLAVRCLSVSRADAIDGRTRAHTAILSAASPAGHILSVTYNRPLDVPQDADGIYTRMSLYNVVLRRVG